MTDGVRGNSVLIIMKLMIKLSRGWQRYDPQDNFSLAPVFTNRVLSKDSLLSYLQLIYDWFCITVTELISYDAYCMIHKT